MPTAPMRVLFQTTIAALTILIVAPFAKADDGAAPIKAPQIAVSGVDWETARKASLDLIGSASDDEKINPLSKLNEDTSKIFAGVETSPVPVLLPFDTAAFARDGMQNNLDDGRKYLSGFGLTLFFPGPSGYDAVLSMRPNTPGLGLTYAKPVDVEISGAAFLYELDGPSPAAGESVTQLEAQFPGIRRSLVESHLRYTFVRFGVPYVVAIACFDGPATSRRLSCREADKVALRFLQALSLVGGSPATWAANATPRTVDRPEKVSPDFTYFAPGDLIPGSGVHDKPGRADDTVYARIRFPIAQAPDFAVSQSFMNWGNCDLTGRVGLSGGGYHCRVNDKPLVNDEGKNFAYPWRDNFCEHRTYEVSQCPGGMGHQGQDIRPSFCFERDPAAGRCEPYQEDAVAVSDGVVIRDRGDLALYLLVDKPGEHVRFRYLHMNPAMLDAAGMLTGRRVVEGEVLGSVGSYGESERGTSYHLHFDAQVPTHAGWVFINPYMTLVGAYERLIGGRGKVVNDAMFAAPAAVANTTPPLADGTPVASIATPKATEAPRLVSPSAIAKPEPESAANKQAGVASENKQAEHCTMIVHRGHHRRVCSSDDTEARGRDGRDVRSTNSSGPEQGRRARHRGRYVHARHGGDSS